MQEWFYLLGLLVSIGGLLVIDRRLKLAFWHDHARSLQTILSAVAVFIVWDMLGIGLGIFYHGSSQYALPFRLLPEFPIEELAFLVLLCYVTLLLYLGGRRRWPRT